MKKSFIPKIVLFIAGLFVQGLGVAVLKLAELGESPLVSVPNVLSIKVTSITIGTWLFLWNMFLLVVQVILFRKNFKAKLLLQIPISFVYGYIVDLMVWIVFHIQVDAYYLRVMLTVLGAVLLAFGSSLCVKADLVFNTGEAIVKAVAFATKRKYGTAKLIVDIGCVATAVILSLILFNFKVVGVREGTLIVAVLTGFMVKLFLKLLKYRE